MSYSQTDKNFELTHPRPEHFVEIQELCRKVYPFSKPWSIEQLESHHAYFPGGQLIVLDTETRKVVGLAFSLIILWDDYSPQDNWADFTSGGFFHNHNPKKGKTLYGAEIMVDPEFRGLGIGKMLYQGRQDIVAKYNLKRIRAGARLRGYSKFKDKLTPYEYVIQVVKKQIYDPTLSFQINQGFVVIDVAKNYLYNDPESLGYAAVIEWLNPQTATAKDLKRQKERVEALLSNQKYVPEFLSRELHRLVRKSTLTLGEIIQESEGPLFSNRLEQYRNTLKKMRISPTEDKLKLLLNEIHKEFPAHQFKIAHAFALHLELVNICEIAYRTWRLRQKPLAQGFKERIDLKFLLSVHPTETRSPAVVELLQRLCDLLIDGILNNFVLNQQELKSHIRLLWQLPLSKPTMLTVLDEAEFIFSYIFSDKFFDSFVSRKPNYDLKIRTLIGGDRAGQPSINVEVMKKCLTLSRGHILDILQKKLNLLLDDIQRFNGFSIVRTLKIDSIKILIRDLETLKKISNGDGNRIKKWAIKFRKFLVNTTPLISKHYQISHIHQILEIFPAFVLPIELRESSNEIRAALINKQAPIRQMLIELSKISGALSITYYARGLVIARCQRLEDIENADKLIWLTARTKTLPAIPLFESQTAFLKSKEILKSWLQKQSNIEQVKTHWFGYFEVMLGYSDLEKEIGALPSRQLIQKSMLDIESTFRSTGIKPVFFHGPGCNINRGGGSLKEQISWWPKSAIEKPKITIQDEMVQRLFTSKEILNSQCTYISNESMRSKIRKIKLSPCPALTLFSNHVEAEYKKIISEPSLLKHLFEDTPYKYLDLMRNDPRSAIKRIAPELSTTTLRAIPWSLSWTQTRSLLPTWWGLGTAWKKLTKEDQEKLKLEFRKNPMLSSFIKSLGFTLTKVELNIWKIYFGKSLGEDFFKKIVAEYNASSEFVFMISGEKKLLWFHPWLEESIRLRAPYIHMLNILQVLALRRNDEQLLKETLIGISSGMLTTN